MTTHPADGAGRNPDRIEHGFLPLKVNILFHIYTLIHIILTWVFF